jgi:signal transduction histidine kinase
MASLGQLVAGIAHEINTPIGAINASFQNLQRSMPTSLQDLVRFMNQLSPGLHSRFFELLERCANTGPALSSRDERAYRKSVTETLEEFQVPNASEMAKALIRIGVYDNLSPFAELFRQPNAEEIIRVAEGTGKLFFNVANIGLALGKIQKMLFALKNYSRKQVEDEAEEVSIAETMDTVLTIYHNQLKYGITVHRNFAEGLPIVRCFADQLTQVWTNILHNAIQAMDGKGEITVDIEHWPEGKGVKVRMTDNGPGIPPEIQQRIWEPFFTTKPAGEGSGLGLDICRQIVLRHGGSIEVESQPGRTTFTVCLPAEMPPSRAVSAA